MTATSDPSAVSGGAARDQPAGRSRAELLLWGALIVLALALRLLDLGDRPFHHDESQDAYFSWTFRHDFASYHYDPLLHGPLRFFLTAGVYVLFGASDFTARLAPALMGTVCVALPLLLRRQLGRGGALAAAVALCVGPSFLYFSRFAREDIYFATLALGLIVAVWRFLERPSRAGPPVIFALVALMFTCKETAFIAMAVAGAFFIPAALWPRSGVWAAVRGVGWRPWAVGAAAFLVVWAVFFGRLFTDWGFHAPNADGYYSGFLGGFTDGIRYWLQQQPVARGGESPWLYPAILFGDEWPVLLLGGVGIVAAFRRPTVMRLFLVWAFAGSLGLYMWASERFAWLVLHPLLPLILLAGIGVQALWDASRTRGARVALGVVLALGLTHTAYASWQANAQLGANPRELLVSTQSPRQVKDVVRRVRAMGPGTTITVDTHDGATFPYAWYFRDDDVGYIDMTRPGYTPDTDVLIMTQEAQSALGARLAGYRGRRFAFRVWWVRDWSAATSARGWWRYVADRRPWSPTGGLDEYLYVRR